MPDYQLPGPKSAEYLKISDEYEKGCTSNPARAFALFLYRFPGLFPERKLPFSRHIFSLTAINCHESRRQASCREELPRTRIDATT